jgi:hypothetical protein
MLLGYARLVGISTDVLLDDKLNLQDKWETRGYFVPNNI